MHYKFIPFTELFSIDLISEQESKLLGLINLGLISGCIDPFFIFSTTETFPCPAISALDSHTKFPITYCIALIWHQQVREGCQHTHFAAVREQFPQPGRLKAALLFNHLEKILRFGADVSLGRLNQIIGPPLWCIG